MNLVPLLAGIGMEFANPFPDFTKSSTLLSAQKYNLLNKVKYAIKEKSQYFGKIIRNEIGK